MSLEIGVEYKIFGFMAELLWNNVVMYPAFSGTFGLLRDFDKLYVYIMYSNLIYIFTLLSNSIYLCI